MAAWTLRKKKSWVRWLTSCRPSARCCVGAGDPLAAFKALFAGDRLDQAGAKKLLEEKTAALQTGNPEVMAAADFFNTPRPWQQQKVRDFMERDTAQPWFGPAPGHRL